MEKTTALAEKLRAIADLTIQEAEDLRQKAEDLRAAADLLVEEASKPELEPMPVPEPEPEPTSPPASESGQYYIWQGIAISVGTSARFTRDRRDRNEPWHYANIESVGLRYNDNVYSPNQFCRLIAGNARDAWRDLYIQRPTGEWVVADRLRQEGKAKHKAYVATARGNVIELGQHHPQ
jgi:hypothetical protein